MIRVAIFSDSASRARRIADLLAEDDQIEVVDAGSEAFADVIVAAGLAQENLPPAQRRLPDRSSDDDLIEQLTRRELEVLGMLANGLGNKEVAGQLGISDHTAKFHVAQILAKLGAGSRTEAVMIAIRRGIIPI